MQKGRLWRAYLVLGSVGWWVRGWIELEVRVEELKGKSGTRACIGWFEI